MRIFKKIAAVVGFVAAVALVNCAFTFALDPYGSKSQIMWNDYKQQDELNMVIVGTSLSERAFDPVVLEENTQLKSYNMATPSQLLEESYLGMVKAIEEHSPEVVVLGFELSQVEDDAFPDPGRSFIRFKNEDNPMANVSDAIYPLSDERNYGSKASINWMFPWIKSRVGSPEKMIDNIRMKLNGTDIYKAAEKNEVGWIYYGKGYGNYTAKFDYNKGTQTLALDNYTKGIIQEDKMEILAQMCDYCEERGIDFVVAAPPIPCFNIFKDDKIYLVNNQAVSDLVREHGGEFYDFNMAKPEIFDTSRTDYFADTQHLNASGGEQVSMAFSTVLNAQRAGESVDEFFYAADEYKDVKDYVDLVKLTASVQDKGVKLTAKPYAGASSSPEYRFYARLKGEKEWTLIRDWDSKKTFTYEPDVAGDYELRVNVRSRGNDVDYERYRIVSANVK